MDLSYSPADVQFREATRRWLEANVPRAEPATLEERRAWHRKLYDAGFVGMGWPKRVRRPGARARSSRRSSARRWRARTRPAPSTAWASAFIGPTLIAHGTEDAEAALRPEDPDGRGALVPALLGAGRRLRPGQPQDDARSRDGDHYVVNGQKVWTSGGVHRRLRRSCWPAPTPRAPKHKGISYFILDMHAPGRRGAAAEADHRQRRVLRGVPDQRQGARREPDRRGGPGLGAGPDDARVRARRQPAGAGDAPQGGAEPADRGLPDAAAQRRRGHRRPAGAPEDRPDDGRDRGAALRRACGCSRKLEKGQRPGPESSVDKLYYSEMDKRHQELDPGDPRAVRPDVRAGCRTSWRSDLAATRDGEDSWAHNFLWSRAGTIYAGSSEIQKNIIGERVLGLPKEVRADRVRA